VDQLVFQTLLLIHVAGAIVGFGPVFTFSLLGPMAGRAGPNGVYFLEAILAIEKRLVIPVAVVTQPLSGLALIFVGGFASDFFRHYWLVVGITFYLVAFYLAIFQQAPAIERMVHLAKSGPPTPEFMALAKKTQRLGPITTVLLVGVIFLMVVKPGS
jgi:uncharacterized membrane protein